MRKYSEQASHYSAAGLSQHLYGELLSSERMLMEDRREHPKKNHGSSVEEVSKRRQLALFGKKHKTPLMQRQSDPYTAVSRNSFLSKNRSVQENSSSLVTLRGNAVVFLNNHQ